MSPSIARRASNRSWRRSTAAGTGSPGRAAPWRSSSWPAKGHFSAADLIDDARARRLGIGRATIFRALDLFTELSVLERLDLPTGEHAYVPCEPAGHHHHIVCSGCGRVTEIEEVGLALEDVQRRTGWQVDSHRLELYGRCPRCRSGHSP